MAILNMWLGFFFLFPRLKSKILMMTISAEGKRGFLHRRSCEDNLPRLVKRITFTS